MDEPKTNLDDDRVSAIESEFSRWQAWVSETGQWWAAVRAIPTPGRTAAGCVPFLHAENPDELVQRIREQENLYPTEER